MYGVQRFDSKIQLFLFISVFSIESELSPFSSLTSVCLDLTDIEAAERDVMAKGLRKVKHNITRLKLVVASAFIWFV